MSGFSSDHKVDLIGLANKALEDAAKQLLMQMFGEASQWAMDDRLRDAVREKARDILKEPEIVNMLRDKIKQYINDPAAMSDRRR